MESIKITCRNPVLHMQAELQIQLFLCASEVFLLCLDILCGARSANTACSTAPFVLTHVTRNVHFMGMCVFAYQEYMASLTIGWAHAHRAAAASPAS